jgi:hypothetical protein
MVTVNIGIILVKISIVQGVAMPYSQTLFESPKTNWI